MMEQNKKVLFISPIFFDYYKNIIDAIQRNFNYEVTWYADRPSEHFIDKVVIRVNRKILARKNNRYFKKIKESCIKNKYDYVFVIFGQFLNHYYIRELRNLLPNTKFIYYTWDSSCIYSVIDDIANEFDVKYSFDLEDTKKGFKFLPLFYSNEIISSSIEYDAVSIFTVKPGKMLNYEKIKAHLPSDIKIYEYLYIQSRLVFRFYKIKYKAEFKKYKMKDFKYKKLSREETNLLCSKAKTIIDCQMMKQNGLTIRTFETLNLKKKLITTNNNILNYYFYNENNIRVVTDEMIDNNFFESSFDETMDITKYSIDNFVKKIFSDYSI